MLEITRQHKKSWIDGNIVVFPNKFWYEARYLKGPISTDDCPLKAAASALEIAASSRRVKCQNPKSDTSSQGTSFLFEPESSPG